MTVFAATAQTAAPRLTWRSVLDAWRGIGRDDIVPALLFGCIVLVSDFGAGSILLAALTARGYEHWPGVLAVHFLLAQLDAFGLLACIAVARHLSNRHQPQATYVIAIAASAALAALLRLIGMMTDLALNAPGMSDISFQTVILSSLWGGFFQWLIMGGAATFMYIDWRQAQAARARMCAAELERTRSSRRALEARLQSMQARVEPQFLFNTLAQVRALHREDTARGERMLDELIAYLRAAMPKMRDTASTLGQEIELARAYLAIVEVRLADRLSVSIDVPADCGEARMPPMMLLPLVEHAIGPDPEDVPAPRSIAIRSAVTNGTLRIEVASRGGSPAAADEDAGIAEMRERLAALYGVAASLELMGEPALTAQAVLTIPFEAPAP